MNKQTKNSIIKIIRAKDLIVCLHLNKIVCICQGHLLDLHKNGNTHLEEVLLDNHKVEDHLINGHNTIRTFLSLWTLDLMLKEEWVEDLLIVQIKDLDNYKIKACKIKTHKEQTHWFKIKLEIKDKAKAKVIIIQGLKHIQIEEEVEAGDEVEAEVGEVIHHNKEPKFHKLPLKDGKVLKKVSGNNLLEKVRIQTKIMNLTIYLMTLQNLNLN
jgi:hypothetical protein